MKIDYKNAETTIINLVKQNTIKCLVLYGESISSVENKYRLAINTFKKDSFDISNINPDLMKSNEGFLCEEFLSISMFATKTLYTLRLVEKENSYTKDLETLFENNNLDTNPNFLLVTTNNLDSSSSLRKYAEKSKYIACVACYEESEKNLMVFIANKLKEFNFIFNGEVVEYLFDNIGNNSLIIENEIKKIDLFKGEDRKLTIDDVEKIVIDISSSDINDFCNSFCDLNANETFKILNKIFNEDTEPIVLIRSLSKHFLQLQKIRFFIDSGNDLNDVFKSERIFWKQQIFIRNYIQKWSLKEINFILEKLLSVEKESKFSSNGKLTFENFILRCFLREKQNKKTSHD